MAQSITLMGATYPDVPSILLPKSTSGMAQFDDTTIASNAASAADIASGKQAFVNGSLVTGTASGGGSSYTLLGSFEVSVNTTSTSSANVGTEQTISRTSHTAKKLYILVTDKAGKKNGYFYGTETYWEQPSGGSTSNNYRMTNVLRTNSSGKVESTSTSQYGVFPGAPTFSSGSVKIQMRARYSSSYSGTINGTYVVKVYDLAWPDNSSPFA